MDHDAQMAREAMRSEVVKTAVEAADKVILDSSDGTIEMTNGLTLGTAIVLLEAIAFGKDRLSEAIGKIKYGPFAPYLQTIKNAVYASYDRLDEAKEKHPAVIRWMRYELAERFVKKVGYPIGGELTRYELEHPATGK